ncbi:hypothetical protein BH09BAC2_BH09BAC2_05320 [soil metagenome]
MIIKCKLCLINNAGSQESHIIPKFFAGKLLSSNRGRKGTVIKFVNFIMGEHDKPQQDLPKERYLFCEGCERYFRDLDTYFCNHIYRSLRNSDSYGSFIKLSSGKFMWASKEENETIIKLFLSSLLFRCHCSNIPPFNKFFINKKEEEYILKNLIHYKSDGKNDLIKKAKTSIFDNQLRYLIFTYGNKSKILHENNYISANYKSKVGIYNLVINDYVITYYFNNILPDGFLECLNQNNQTVRIYILSDEEYNYIKNQEVSQMHPGLKNFFH